MFLAQEEGEEQRTLETLTEVDADGTDCEQKS